jgi:hypothetical protein
MIVVGQGHAEFFGPKEPPAEAIYGRASEQGLRRDTTVTFWLVP